MPRALSQGEEATRSLDSRWTPLLPRAKTGGAILHSAICFHCVFKHNAFNSLNTKDCRGSSVSRVWYRQQAGLHGNRRSSAGWGRRFLHSAHQINNKVKGLNVHLVLILRIYGALPPHYAFSVLYLNNHKNSYH